MGLLTNLGLRRPDAPLPAARGRYDITGVTVINPARERRSGATIEVSDGAIAAISDASAAPASEYAGCFALPGLIDMHVHLPPHNALKLTVGTSLLFLAHGVTTLREAGDIDGTTVEAARQLLREDTHPVPRVYFCGPFICAGKAPFKNTILLEDASPAAAEAAALRVKALGASFMKFYEGLTEPMIRELERAGAKHDLKIMGHVPAGLSYEEARISEVQHFLGVPELSTLEGPDLINRASDWHAVDERRMDAIVETSLKFGIANTPTIVTSQKMLCYRDYEAARGKPEFSMVPPFYLDVVWHPEFLPAGLRFTGDYMERQVAPAIAKKQRLTKKLFDAGAKLFLGTDVALPFVVPGKSLQEEMALFVGAGIGLEQVWKLATADAADRLGVSALGRLQNGAPADILLFRRDPTERLENLSSLEAVIAAGKLYRVSELKRAVQANQAYFASPLIKPLAKRGAKRAIERARA
jgi:imidazolonepropionase-like amidohydrolase